MPAVAAGAGGTRRGDDTLPAFEAWLRAHAVAVEGFALSRDGVRGGVGAVATRALRCGDVLFRVPAHLQLTADASALAGALRAWGVTGWPALALTLAHEHALGGASRWAAYLAFLPHLHEASLHLPLLWAADELRDAAGTGMCARAGRERVEAYYARVVAPFVRRHARHFPAGLSAAEFAHYGAVVSAYSFTTTREGGEVVAMVPLADALNADGADSCSARLEAAADGVLQMVVMRSIARGEEVLNTYGRLAESEALLRYGYIGSETSDGGTAVTVREIFEEIERAGSDSGGVQRARLSLAVRRMAQEGVVVDAAPREANPFMDCGKVLPLNEVDEACEQLERVGLSPRITVGAVIERRLTLLERSNKNDRGGNGVRELLARRLRGCDLPRLREALQFITERNSQ